MASMRRPGSAIAAVVLWLIAPRPLPAFVLGGGLANKDCRVAFDGVDVTDGVSGVVCTDGDATCDRDGTADGRCRFNVGLCTGVVVAGCAPDSVSSLAVAGLPLDIPPLPSGAGVCGTPSAVTVAVGTAAGATAVARAGSALKDVDYLVLCCRTVPAPFDAARCTLAVDPGVAGCTRPVPTAITAALERGRSLLERAAAEPLHAPTLARDGVRALKRMRRLARHLARVDVCGDALGLMASHARATVDAALARYRRTTLRSKGARSTASLVTSKS